MMVRDPLHCLHDKLIMVGREVRVFINRRQLVLGGSDFVVLCFGGNAQFPELYIEILHELSDAFPDDSEIMILHLLSFGRGRSEQRPAREDEVFALQGLVFIDEEILLLGAG